MLHIETVEPGTFSLLKRLQAIPELDYFFLVGGTALSLKYGHRLSVDIDFFGHTHFDKEHIKLALEKEFGDDFVYAGNPVKWALFSFINNIKVDIVFYNHPIIEATEAIENIRMYSTEDIIAMKINAILGRGMKKDDKATLFVKEYKEINGIKFPGKYTLGFGPIESEIENIAIKINEGLDEKWYHVK